ncbi:MAG: ATP-binding protein [Candidatus Thermoplasmatota archaeon]|nr:ATP-binding protein [Candidatus Thermoplasmatota archaeon]
MKKNIDLEEDDRSPELVGRKDELKAVLDSIKGTEEGKGGMILVQGEAGIGKSVLINKVTRTARDRGYTILKGKCLHYRGGPYMPFIDMLRDRYGIDSGTLDWKVINGLKKKMKKDLGSEDESLDELMELIMPVGEVRGPYQYDIERMDDIIMDLSSSGTKIMVIGGPELEEDRGTPWKDVRTQIIAKDHPGALDPKRIEMIANLIKSFLVKNRHGTVIFNSYDDMIRTNPKMKMKKLIKITSDISRNFDGEWEGHQ